MIRLMGRKRVAIFIQSLNIAYRTSRLKNFLDRKVSGIFLRLGDIVITSGQVLAAELAELGVRKERIRIIYPAIRDEFRKYFAPLKARGMHKGVTVLWVGRVHPIKGLEYLIEAMASFKRVPNVRLVLVGDDSLVLWYTERIAALVTKTGLQEKVDRRGRIDSVDTLFTIYSEADIFVLPSVWDTSPIVLVEAMSFGLPIVATAAGGAREWVQDGVNGFLVPPANVPGLTDPIGRLIADSAMRKQMGEASLEKSFCYRDRSWHDVGREYCEALLPLLTS
jgi:glycosyltransferase involved in cell wall biosynthesis